MTLALDITERQKSDQEIRYQATRDGLTAWPTPGNSSIPWSGKSAEAKGASVPSPCCYWI